MWIYMCGGYSYMWIYMSGGYTCVHGSLYNIIPINRALGYERVYLPLYRVTDTPFHIQGDVISLVLLSDHVVLILIPKVG